MLRRQLFDADQVDKIVISVLDTGKAISKKSKQNFINCDSQGLSLEQGLIVSKKIAGELNGDLVVQSHEGEGTRYSFSLMIEEQPFDSSTQIGYQAQNCDEEQKILVVDSDVLNALSLTQLLTSLGIYQVEKCFSFEEAMKLVLLKRYQFIIMDLDQ